MELQLSILIFHKSKIILKYNLLSITVREILLKNKNEDFNT